MVRQPWRRDGDDEDDDTPVDGEPIVECAFQDGSIAVYDDRVVIDRAGPSRFDDKIIPRDEILDVTYAKGIAIGYLQIEQRGVENDTGGFLSSPVDENTLHFGRGARDCAEEAKQALLFGGS